MVRVDDHKRSDGSLDWAAYRVAQVQAGERCRECGGHIGVIGAPGHPQRCGDCERFEKSAGEVSHDSRIRCPKCGRSWDPSECDDHHLCADGEHHVSCLHCGHDFRVTTHVSFTFHSPARIP